MNEMVERVARAITKAISENDKGGLSGWDSSVVARAAIAAMRVPTEAMEKAGGGYVSARKGKTGDHLASVAYTVMIATALAE